MLQSKTFWTISTYTWSVILRFSTKSTGFTSDDKLKLNKKFHSKNCLKSLMMYQCLSLSKLVFLLDSWNKSECCWRLTKIFSHKKYMNQIMRLQIFMMLLSISQSYLRIFLKRPKVFFTGPTKSKLFAKLTKKLACKWVLTTKKRKKPNKVYLKTSIESCNTSQGSLKKQRKS